MAEKSTQIVTKPLTQSKDVICGCMPFFRRSIKAAEGPSQKEPLRKRIASKDSKFKEMAAKGLADKSADITGVSIKLPDPESATSVSVGVDSKDKLAEISGIIVTSPAPKNSTSGTVSAIGTEAAKTGDSYVVLPLTRIEANGCTVKESQTSRMQEARLELNDVVAKLEEAMGKDSTKREEIDLRQIPEVHDINCMAQKVGSTIAKYMDERKYSKANRTEVKVFMEGWFKRSIPFVKQCLKVGNVWIS